MRINDIYGSSNDRTVESTGRAAPVQAPRSEGHGESQVAPGGEKVTVSDEAKQLAAKSASDAETEKVGRLRAAIQDGSFKVDTHAIAKRIVEGG